MSELRGLDPGDTPDQLMKQAAAARVAPQQAGQVISFPRTGQTPYDRGVVASGQVPTATQGPDALRAQTVAWWQQNGGVPLHVAQGIADQVNKESGFDPTLPGDAGTSVGLYQAHDDRKESLQAQPNWQDPRVQHQWALSQVTGGDPVATAHWNEIKNAKTREEASRLWQQYFERPAGSAGAGHEQYISAGREELSRVGSQISKLVDQLSKEGGRSKETWDRLREATDKMNEFQEKALDLARHPPSPDPRDAFQRLGGLATVVGILGGLLTKQPLMASLNAGAAAMEAYNKGDEKTYEYERDNWKRHSDILLKLSQFQHEQIRDVLYDENLQAGQRMNLLSATLSALGHQEQAAMAVMGDERSLRQFEAQMAQANRQFSLQMDRLRLMEEKKSPTEQYVESLDREWQQQHPGEAIPESVKQEHLKQGLREAPGGTAQAGRLPPETLQRMAKQYVATGDRSMLTGLGYGSAGAANRADLQTAITDEMKSAGVPPEEMGVRIAEFQGIMAGERTLGQRTANIGMAVSSAQQLLPLAEQASKLVPRSQYPKFNEWLLAAERQMGEEAPVKLSVAVNSFLNAYSRAVAPTGVPTDDVRRHAYELLEKAFNEGQFTAALNQMSLEMRAEQQAPGTVRSEFRHALLNRVGNDYPNAAPATGGAGLPEGIPPGSQKIGTSGGNDVYQTPDGRRLMVH